MRNESADIIKLAVAFEARTELFKIDQSIPLAPQLQDLCNVWKLPAEECGDYGLLFDPEKSKDISDRYITEDNRSFIKLGSMLKLTLSPEKMSDKIAGVLKRLPPGTLNEGEVVLEAEEATKVLSDLLYLSVDSTFINAFNRSEIKGLDLIMETIQTGRATGNHLETCLQVFVNMMVEGARPWEEVPDAFVKKIMSLSEQPMANVQGSIMHSILVILENLLLAGPDAKFNLIDARVNYSILANHLEYSEKKVSQAVVALVNALMQKAPTADVRQRIGRNVVHDMRQAVLAVVRNCNGVPWTEMYDQLYQLQFSLLGLYETKFLAIVEPGSVDDMDKVKHLRRVAFDEAGVVGNDKDKRKDHYSLGFSDEADPLKDFSAPPARLALDCLAHYADNYERQFARMAIENSSRDPGKFQLVEAAVKLVTLLCDVLEIRSTPAPQESNGSPVPGATTLGGSMAMRNNLQPMFFSSEYPLEDFFCRCMDLFQKTWKEMKATVQDMDKVLEVVQEQLKRALALKPPAMSFGGFADHLENLSFAQIKAMRDMELDRHFRTAEQAEPIRQLRDTLKVEIISIIAEQRTLFLTDGSRFIKTAGRGRLKDGVKYWFCRLAPNRKALHYGDCKEEKDETIPSIDSLQSKLELANVDELVVGDKCPHYNKGKVAGHYFSLRYRNDGGEYESLNFICSDEKTFHYWCDGINCLLRGENAMDSQEFERDMEILLSMEVKLRLLDVGALEIPEKAPELPPLPKKFLPA